MTELTGHGVQELAQLLQARTVSSVEVTQAFLKRIGEGDRARAWVRTYPEMALEQAAAADARLSAAAVGRDGPAPPLCGVPFGLKDVIAVAGLPLTLGSAAFEDQVGGEDASSWERLRDQGAVPLGHTRTQELASGDAPQTVANPWDLGRSPGGSSNGSAAAVAAGTAPFALGTDVGGSLRRPASACGLTTIIGTAGRVSMRGSFTFNAAADHVGPLAWSAADCALVLAVLAGHDPGDAATHGAPPLGALPTAPTPGERPLAGRRIGVLELPPEIELAPSVAEVQARFEEELRRLGAELLPVAGPPRPPADPRPRQEQVTFFRRHLAERGDRFTAYTRERGVALLEAAEALGVAPADAGRAEQAYRAAWAALFREHELSALALPAQTRETPLVPPADEGGDLERFGDQGIRAMWNVLGWPVVCLPAGGEDGGLPIGAQLAGAPWTEAALLQTAIDYQSRTPHHESRPPATLPPR
ncbi:MAG TPA: amidase [Solirubrobacteraceae bacterium]|nr:amidase [Solirubrobacteraceae bacterium]